MTAAATQAPARVFTNTRRVPRSPWPFPRMLPSCDLESLTQFPGARSPGERGVGLVIAGELHPGDSVGIEFRLPDAGGPFRLKAIVRLLRRCFIVVSSSSV